MASTPKHRWLHEVNAPDAAARDAARGAETEKLASTAAQGTPPPSCATPPRAWPAALTAPLLVPLRLFRARLAVCVRGLRGLRGLREKAPCATP